MGKLLNLWKGLGSEIQILSRLGNFLRELAEQVDTQSAVIPTSIVGCVPQSVKFYGAKGDGVTDDAPAFQNAIDALAGTGIPLCIPVGTYRFASSGMHLRSDLMIQGEGQGVVLLKFELPALGAFSEFTCGWFMQPIYGLASTLAANAAVGDRTVSSNASYPVGTVISIDDGAFQGSSYIVTAVVGGGPFTLTLDRSLELPFTAGDAILALGNRPENIILSGFTATGTCVRFQEIVAGKNCELRDVAFNDSLGFSTELPASFDVWGVGNRFTRVNVRGPNGIALETNERSYMYECYFEGTAGGVFGFLMNDCVACEAHQSSAFNCDGDGFLISAQTNPNGCLGCTISGGTFDGNARGINSAVQRDTLLRSLICRGNTGSGISAGNGTHVVECVANNNQVGIQTVGSNFAVVLTDCDVSGNDICGLQVHVDTVCKNLKSLGGNSDSIVQVIANNLFLDGFDLTQDTLAAFPPNGLGIRLDAGKNVIKDGVIHLTGANNQGILTTAAAVVAIFEDITIDGAGGVNSITTTAGSTIREIRTRTAIARNYAVGTFVNVGNVVANNAVAVPVAWPDLLADPADPITLTRTVNGGAPGIPPVVAKTPGVGFSITGVAGDTSTYQYIVGT